MSNKPNKPAADSPSAADLVHALREQYKEWQPIHGESRSRLYKLLGDMYAAIPLVEASKDAHNKLADLANEDINVRNSKRFDAWKADNLDLLLVCVLGLREETRATKSQWRSVLLAAGIEEAPGTSEAFQEWIRAKGGIVEVLRGEVHAGLAKLETVADSASASAKEDEALATLVAGKFDMKKWIVELAKAPPTERLKLTLDTQADLHEGVGVLLYYYAPNASKAGEVAIVQKIGDPRVVRHVAAEVELGHVRNLTDDEKRARLLDKYLWALNKVALILAGRFRAKTTMREYKAFVSAVEGITKEDRFKQRFFEGDAGVAFQFLGHGETFSMTVKNPDFLEIDPGRYFPGARMGELIPYDVSEIGTPQGDQAIKAYIMQHTEPWRYQAAR